MADQFTGQGGFADLLSSMTKQLETHLGSIDQSLETVDEKSANKTANATAQSQASASSPSVAQNSDEQKQAAQSATSKASNESQSGNATQPAEASNVTQTLDSITELLKSSFGETSKKQALPAK